MLDKDATISALQRRNDMLALRVESMETERAAFVERIDELEKVLSGLNRPVPLEWGLTANEERMFGVLVRHETASKEAFMLALYDNLNRDRPEIKIVDVFICKLRKKVERFGVTIETVWGRGYKLVDRSAYRQAA